MTYSKDIQDYQELIYHLSHTALKAKDIHRAGDVSRRSYGTVNLFMNAILKAFFSSDDDDILDNKTLLMLKFYLSKIIMEFFKREQLKDKSPFTNITFSLDTSIERLILFVKIFERLGYDVSPNSVIFQETPETEREKFREKAKWKITIDWSNPREPGMPLEELQKEANKFLQSLEDEQ